MIFQAEISIPASTAATSPTRVTFGIAKGIITEVKVRPRPGHNALAHLVMRYHTHQIAPSSESMDFHGDTYPIDWAEYWEVYQPPYELDLLGWNDDTLFAHTFDVYIVVLPRRAVLPLAIVDAIAKLFSLISPKRIFTGG